MPSHVPHFYFLVTSLPLASAVSRISAIEIREAMLTGHGFGGHASGEGLRDAGSRARAAAQHPERDAGARAQLVTQAAH